MDEYDLKTNIWVVKSVYLVSVCRESSLGHSILELLAFVVDVFGAVCKGHVVCYTRPAVCALTATRHEPVSLALVVRVYPPERTYLKTKPFTL